MEIHPEILKTLTYNVCKKNSAKMRDTELYFYPVVCMNLSTLCKMPS